MHVHYMTMPQHKNPCSRDNSIYNFGKLFLGHHYTLNLSDLCLCEEKILKEIMHFHNMTTLHKHPCPRGHEIYNFSRPFLGHHNYTFSLSVLCLGVEKKILKEIMYFYYIMSQHKNPCPRGHDIYNFDRTFLGNHYLIHL